ncbi:MAG: CocE/NonD family hydrolase [Deltaproteobacteria bacterium]|nr:CocE/NonD family hydrolase [Deltaproteobacteria bacterium]MBW2153792.1 CocE/NonD family hydrolase [Deltaproteobacteria bacterium]
MDTKNADVSSAFSDEKPPFEPILFEKDFMIHISGWYDAYCASAIQNYRALSRLKKSSIQLLMGPWLHGESDKTYAGDVEFGPEAAISGFFDAWHLRWFDHFLKGKDNGLAEEAPVKIFVMGTGDGRRDENGRLFHGGYWRSEVDWPLPSTRFTNFYFHSDGSLSTELPGANDPPTTYTYDPWRPVPTIGGPMAASEPVFAGGGFDQREREYTGDPKKGFFGSRPPYLPLKARPDVVVFQTDPLCEPVEIIGPTVVRLYASSTATDTDFTVKLIDVYPPSKDFPSGFDLNLTDGILRARYRVSPEHQELMKPGEIYVFTIEPFPTANLFKTGHRIRIDISSSNFPRFDVNPNTGEPLGMNRRMIPADNTIYHDLIHPSHVILPVIPNGANQ